MDYYSDAAVSTRCLRLVILAAPRSKKVMIGPEERGPFMDLSTALRDWNDPGASTPVKGRTMRLFDSKASAKASLAKWIWFSRSQSTRKKAVRTARWP